MRNVAFVSAAAALVLPLASAPVRAQTEPQRQQQEPKKVPDPNETVCEKQEVLGSRIASKRVCMTRSQWAEQRRLDRQDIDKAQTQAPMAAPH